MKENIEMKTTRAKFRLREISLCIYEKKKKLCMKKRKMLFIHPNYYFQYQVLDYHRDLETPYQIYWKR